MVLGTSIPFNLVIVVGLSVSEGLAVTGPAVVGLGVPGDSAVTGLLIRKFGS